MYQPYADATYYTTVYGGTLIPQDERDKSLTQASRHIDTLTYNRIVARGIDTLTAFQEDVVQRVCCMMADFEYDNADMINTVLQSYSINGASMTFGESWNLRVQDGVAVQRDTYSLLSQTGLCSSCLGV